MLKLKWSYLSLIATVCLVLQACSTKQVRQQETGDNKVLDLMVSGTTAFAKADYDLALEQFNLAAQLVDAIWANTEDADRASSLWYTEKAKNFKGEPYERTMVFYYLGLLYIMSGDYGNAQAAFKRSLLYSVTVDGSNSFTNFDVAMLLAGLSLDYLGSKGPAQDLYREYLNKYQSLPFDPDNRPNLVVIYETGKGPEKSSPDRAQLSYVNNEPEIPQVSLKLSPDLSAEVVSVSVYDLAISRDLRQADLRNKSKQNTKEFTQGAGQVLTETGGDLIGSTDHDSAGVAAALIAAGIIAAIVSDSILVEADTRTWHNLPGSVHLSFWQLDPGDYQLEIALAENDHQPRQAAITINDDPQLNLLWFSEFDRQSVE